MQRNRILTSDALQLSLKPEVFGRLPGIACPFGREEYGVRLDWGVLGG